MAHRLSCLWRVASSWTRDRTCVPCVGRRILSTGPPGKSLDRVLLFHSSIDGHLGCFHLFLPVVINVAMNMGIQIFRSLLLIISFKFFKIH